MGRVMASVVTLPNTHLVQFSRLMLILIQGAGNTHSRIITYRRFADDIMKHDGKVGGGCWEICTVNIKVDNMHRDLYPTPPRAHLFYNTILC